MGKRIRKICYSKNAEGLSQSAFNELCLKSPIYSLIPIKKRDMAIKADYQELTGKKWVDDPPPKSRKAKKAESPKQ